MFISSLTLTAVVLACVSFCMVRVAATTPTTTPPAGTQVSPRKHQHHHHHHSHHHHHPHHQQQQQQQDSAEVAAVDEGGGGGKGHPLFIKVRNFISTDALYDGEQEKRIHYNGITAKETAVSTSSNDSSIRESIKLRQLTDGIHFIQLILSSDNEIRDCEFLRQKKIVRDFLETFRKDVERAKAHDELAPDLRNVTFLVLDDGVPLPEDVAQWLDFHKLKHQCQENHRETKRLLRHRDHGTEQQRREATQSLERKKRGIYDMLILPDTKWCGHKHIAKDYLDLGGMSGVDRCCRRHDHCPRSIPGFSTKYSLLNYNPFSISHCNCDKSFRACLKMAESGAANIVGKLFFNVVQTKCFVLKPEKMCTKRSWWGKCLKHGYRKRAYLRDNVSY